jgi:hypothetical protein
VNYKTNLGFVDLQGLTQSLSVNLYFEKNSFLFGKIVHRKLNKGYRNDFLNLK